MIRLIRSTWIIHKLYFRTKVVDAITRSIYGITCELSALYLFCVKWMF